MRKFLLICAVAMLSFTASAAIESNVAHENDVGYIVPNVSMCSSPVVNYTIEAWQAPLMLNLEVSDMSAQVVYIYSDLAEPIKISETLVQFQWPTNEEINYLYQKPSFYNNNVPRTKYVLCNNSFTVRRTKLS